VTEISVTTGFKVVLVKFLQSLEGPVKFLDQLKWAII
jgi:hypothetical protein